MFRSRLMQKLSTAALLLPLLLAACATPAAVPDETDTPPTPQEPQGTITTEGVQVAPGSHIQFQGRSTLPDGTLLQAQLSADDTPVSWWPDQTSFEVQDGRWQIRVVLGEGGAPQELSTEKQYVLRVWEQGNPELEAEPFPFDLSGPPTEPQGTVSEVAEVEEIDILLMESFPVQVAVVARGVLRDACTEIDAVRQSFDAEASTFTVEITTVRDAEAVCAQVLAPFEERIALDVYGLPADTYTVDVNGVTDTFTFDVDNAPQEAPTTEISWDEARELILSGDVAQVTQLHSLQVTLQMKDGRRLVTTEPQIDDVFDVVQECGDPCADMVLATE